MQKFTDEIRESIIIAWTRLKVYCLREMIRYIFILQK